MLLRMGAVLRKQALWRTRGAACPGPGVSEPEGTGVVQELARTIRAPRGTTLRARSWQTEPALRMLMNNLDPDVAERPGDLVVYGGIGRAARDWPAVERIGGELRRPGGGP